MGDLSTAKAHWVAADTVPGMSVEVAICKLLFAGCALKIRDGKVVGGESLSLRVDKAGERKHPGRFPACRIHSV
jgi:hypothetical protein